MGLRAAVALGVLGCVLATEPNALEPLLFRMERVGDLYLSETLRITCVETIQRSRRSGRQREEFHYVYERDATHALTDYRTAPGSPFKKQTPKGLHLYNAYVWVFLFHPTVPGETRHFEYRDLGSERIELPSAAGRAEEVQAQKILFNPNPPIVPLVNDWYGIAWVDPRDAQLLKVEAVRLGDRALYSELLADPTGLSLPAGTSYTLRTFTTEFSLVKSGMRFPETVVIRDTTHEVVDKDGTRRAVRRELGSVVQTYGSCSFPDVQTEERIRELLGRK